MLLRVLFPAALVLAAAAPRVATPQASAAFIASPTMVYDFRTQHCPAFPAMPPRRCVPDIMPGCDADIVDACPRAWAVPGAPRATYRMLGSVNLVSRAQVGPSLSALAHECAPYANHTADADMRSFRGDEWIEAPAVRGSRVYALAHVDVHNASDGGRYVYTAVTLFASSDGGASFAPARPAPGHLVAASPYVNAGGALGAGIGFGMPSSILRDPASGLSYVILLANWGRDVGAQAGGLCLARTADISDPASWRAWAGGDASDFSARLDASPLLAPVPDPAAYACTPLRDSAGALLGMRHLSLLWSTFYRQYLLFGEAAAGGALNSTGGWAFALSDDLLHWSVPAAVDTAGLIAVAGNASIAPITPMPGRFVTSTAGGVGTWWAAPDGRFKAPVGSCTPCPGLDACHNVTALPPAAFAALPNATFPFTCSLVYATSGVINYVYSVLLDETANADGSDPSLNSVGQDADLFLVAKNCVGASYSHTAGVVACTPLDAFGRDNRDVVRARVRFAAPAALSTA